jgi:hypothetical protein
MCAGFHETLLCVSVTQNLWRPGENASAMPNACFRCKTPIASGETFCRDCSRTVDPSKLKATGESRVWLGVAAFPAWLVVAIPLGVGVQLLAGPSWAAVGFTVVTVVTLLLGFVFLWALVADAEHLAERDDVYWTPSTWLYYGLAGIIFLLMFLPAPFVAAYHLYRRHQTAGLPT